MLQKLKNLGPGLLVTAAFIGPGTVTTSTLAGANFGYALLWALIFATFATIILQEMSARFGVVTGMGLGEGLRKIVGETLLKWPMFLLVTVALVMGNTAYQAGNLSGAILGAEAVLNAEDGAKIPVLAVLVLLASGLIWIGSIKLLERLMMVLVGLMALAFLLTFLVVEPSFAAMFEGAFMPSIPTGSMLTVVALIGTTVVPYNLFLHASASKRHFGEENALENMRTDTIVSVSLGGLITILVVSTAAATMFGQAIEVKSAFDMAVQLRPVFGDFSEIILGGGFLAAGLSSMITAPLATAYVVCEVFLDAPRPQSLPFKAVALAVLFLGALAVLIGFKPVQLIVGAQFANGILLPLLVAFLLVTLNRKDLLGEHANGLKGNVLGGIVMLISLGLGARLVLAALS